MSILIFSKRKTCPVVTLFFGVMFWGSGSLSRRRQHDRSDRSGRLTQRQAGSVLASDSWWAALDRADGDPEPMVAASMVALTAQGRLTQRQAGSVLARDHRLGITVGAAKGSLPATRCEHAPCLLLRQPTLSSQSGEGPAYLVLVG